MLDFPRWKILTILGICLFFFAVALPNFLPISMREKIPAWAPSKTISLGLDLQGGSHLLLQVDFNAYMKEHLAGTLDGLRAEMRKEKVGYQGLKMVNGKIQLGVLPSATGEQVNLDRIARQVDQGLGVNALSAGTYELSFSDAALREIKSQLLQQSIEIVERRVNETGTREPIIQRQGDDRILLQVPGLQDPEHLKKLLGKTAKMTFHLVNTEVSTDDLYRGMVPIGTQIVEDQDEKLQDGTPIKHAVFSRVMLSGDMLTAAAPTFDQGLPAVSFRFNSAGATRFAQITEENVGKPFAIVLDDKVITAPVIRTPILGGSGIITGNFTPESANDLSVLLRAGALPAPLTILEERSVGPSLGSDSITAGKHASILALSLVVGFMLISYGLFGFFANIALVVNTVLVLAALSLFQATLTLPGIAGIVLTLGMAVDANVIINERIREEVRHGRTPFAAIGNGFKVAFATIFDSHMTVLISAAMLYIFGTGTVKGFAVTLTIGTLASLFTAVLVTRMMVVLWLKKVRPKRIPI